MRPFSLSFMVFGAALTILSAAAISDPSSPIGWDDWGSDPWARGLLAGPIFAAIGILLRLGSNKVSRRVDLLVSRILITMFGATAGFAFFAPLLVVTQCDAVPQTAECRAQGWSNILGLRIPGEPTLVLALIASVVAAAAAWIISGRAQKRLNSEEPPGGGQSL